MLSMIMASLFISIITLWMNHPLSLSMYLFMQIIIYTLISGMLSNTFWFSYMLFLMMISGLLIIFMYMTSITSNMKFNLNMKLYGLIFLIPIMIYYNLPINIYANYNYNLYPMLIKFFNMPNTMLIILMIMYLLLTLIATVKIINTNMGTVRKKF